MKKFRNKVLTFLMVKILPLFKYWPLKALNPLINKLVNWYMQKKFPMPKAQPTDPAQPAAQTPPPTEQPKS